MSVKKSAYFVLLLLLASPLLGETFGVKKRNPKPHEYGTIVLDAVSEDNGIEPVLFQHWLHRAKYTCRLCHVDLGFAMEVNGTGVLEEDNNNGLYCGACHNGEEAFAPIEGEGEDKKSNCARCHAVGKEDTLEIDFYDFTQGFPRARYGNRVDWLKAESSGLVTLKDELPGISIPKPDLKTPHDIEIESTEHEMPDIIFSHKLHTIWAGCELCHPQIFKIKKGSTPYDMQAIFDGKFCGACHGKVAFPNMDCQLCHTEDVF